MDLTELDIIDPAVPTGRLRRCCRGCDRGLNTATGILCPTCTEGMNAALARMQDGETL